MNSSQRVLEVAFLALSLLSGLLLSASLGSSHYFLIGGLGAFLALLLVDWLAWFRMPTLVANILSFVVLYLTMRGFFSSETNGQLGSVANLLIYLQMLLLLQDKTPRQYWQLMVLSFLQIVVASVFQMQLEGGLLFIIYMIAAAVFLMMLNSVNQRFSALQLVRPAAGRGEFAGIRKSALNLRTRPEVELETPNDPVSMISSLLQHGFSWIIACLAFASFLFILIPRSDTPWFTGRSVVMAMPGLHRKISLDERGKINLSGNPILTATFKKNERSPGIQLSNAPYFRCMAYGTLALVDGNSTWKAAYDRAYPQNWRTANASSLMRNPLWVQIRQDPSFDATIPTVDPMADVPELRLRAQYSPELSALMRYEHGQEVELLPYEYSFLLAVDSGDRILDSFPYRHFGNFPPESSMDDDPGEREWLTAFDPLRFPGLIRLANAEAQRSSDGNPVEIARRLERWFLSPGRFTYSLDYTAVPRKEGLDSIEDFAVNHRTGHCEMFASALVLMLRSQGIPARYVVGYYGGTYTPAERSYRVNGGHAHAWVEAYIPPRFVTEEQIQQGAASAGGAWLRLDPTPASALRDQVANSVDTIDMARNLWSDYVLNLQSNRQVSWAALASQAISGMLDLNNWSNWMRILEADLRSRPVLYILTLLPGLLLLGAAFWFRMLRSSKSTGGLSGSEGLRGFRSFLGKTLGLISPALGKWIRGDARKTIWFFEQFHELLAKHGMVRNESQTYLEFADSVAIRINGTDDDQDLRRLLDGLIGQFQSVRFGGQALESCDGQALEAQLTELKARLAAWHSHRS